MTPTGLVQRTNRRLSVSHAHRELRSLSRVPSCLAGARSRLRSKTKSGRGCIIHGSGNFSKTLCTREYLSTLLPTTRPMRTLIHGAPNSSNGRDPRRRRHNPNTQRGGDKHPTVEPPFSQKGAAKHHILFRHAGPSRLHHITSHHFKRGPKRR